MSFSASTVGDGSPSLGASPPASSSMLASRSPTLSPRLRSPGGPEGTEKESSLPKAEAGECRAWPGECPLCPLGVAAQHPEKPSRRLTRSAEPSGGWLRLARLQSKEDEGLWM